MTDRTYPTRDIVLIVEDTAANHEVMRSFLNDIDVRCESAYDGMEAVTMCSDGDPNRYSLILMDIYLPHMDGIETAKKLREMGVDTPIIAVTAAGRYEMTLQRRQGVFAAVLCKPFNSTEFFSTISPYIKNAASCSLGFPDVQNPQHDDAAGRPFPDADSIDRNICDISRGIANMGNSVRLFTKHFNHFKYNNADLAIRMRDMINRKEYQECTMLCHSIKGLSGMLGLTSLYEHLLKMEGLMENISRYSCHQEPVMELLSIINNDIRLVCQLQL